MELLRHGQIERMVLPSDWQEGQPEYGLVGGSSFRHFHPGDSDAVKLCLYFRGRRVSAGASESLRLVMEKRTHALSFDEIASLAEVFRDKSDPREFTMTTCKTERFQGRRVLTVEGRYWALDEQIYAIFVDADGTGALVQEIYYQAPAQLYFKHLREATACLKSIEWTATELKASKR